MQVKFDYGVFHIYRSWVMTLFLLEDRDFKGFWMKIWNAGIAVITISTLSSTFCLHIYFQCKIFIISSLFSFIYRIRVHISNPNNLMVTTTYSTAHFDPIQQVTYHASWCYHLIVWIWTRNRWNNNEIL